MEKSTLVKSASEISKVSEDSLKEYVDKMEMLAAKMNKTMLAREDILELIGGEKNITMMKDNHNNHLRFITSILQTPDSETLVDTVLWVFRAYMSRGFSSNYWAAQCIYNWMTVNIPSFTIAAEDKLEKSKHEDH